MKVAICDIHIRSCMGDLDRTWEALLTGKSGLSKNLMSPPFDVYPVGMVPGLDGEIGSADRLDKLIALTIGDASAFPAAGDLIVATTKGAPDELVAAPEGPWPGQPWNLGAMVADRLGVTGRISTVSAACASGTIAIINAAQQIAARQSRVVGVFGIDILSRFVMSGFAKLQALSKKVCRPFDAGRDGLALGEGAGFMVLASEEYARDHNMAILATVDAWGSSCDASHITAPCRNASGLIRTLKQVMSAGVNIAAVNAHGTGTKFNDAMEMVALREVFPRGVTFHGVKGAIGHCLGAAGVIEAAVAVKSLENRTIPPSVGLLEPEMDGITGKEPQTIGQGSVISCNSGFGGINAAILLNK